MYRASMSQEQMCFQEKACRMGNNTAAFNCSWDSWAARPSSERPASDCRRPACAGAGFLMAIYEPTGSEKMSQRGAEAHLSCLRMLVQLLHADRIPFQMAASDWMMPMHIVCSTAARMSRLTSQSGCRCRSCCMCSRLPGLQRTAAVRLISSRGPPGWIPSA